MAGPPAGIGRGSSALRYLSGGNGRGMLDPAAATAPDEEQGGQSLFDMYAGLIGKSKDTLTAAGMQPSQQLPSVPGWAGDTLEPAETPDLQVHAQAMGNSAMTKAVTGLLGQVPMTTWGARHGQKPGEYRTSPAAQAAQDMAEAPWQLEQERVATANKIHAFHNQYAFLKSQAKGKDNENAINMAKDVSTAAALSQYTTGLIGAQKDAQDAALKQQGQRDRDRAEQRAANEEMRREFHNDTQQNRKAMLDLAAARDDRQQETADEMGKIRGRPNKQESQEYAVAHGAQGAIDNMIEALKSDPELTRYTRGSYTWGNLRVSSDPKAQLLAQQRDMAHHNLMQIDPRRTISMGASLLGSTLTKAGDDQPVDISVLRQLHGQAGIVRNAIRFKYHDSKYMTDDDWNGITAGFDQANAAVRASLGVQKPLENMSEEELLRTRDAELGR